MIIKVSLQHVSIEPAKENLCTESVVGDPPVRIAQEQSVRSKVDSARNKRQGRQRQGHRYGKMPLHDIVDSLQECPVSIHLTLK
jgi:hypothetical protein